MKPQITRRAGQSTIIHFPLTGRTIEVPKQIMVQSQGKAFGTEVLAEVRQAMQSLDTEVIGVFRSKTGDFYKLVGAIDKHVLYWHVAHTRSGDLFAAAGFLEFKNDASGYRFHVAAAYAKPEHQGKGIYPQVLKRLKRQFITPIYSDIMLSPLVILMWMKVGRFSKSVGRYRINPPPKAPPKSQKKPRIPLASVLAALSFAYAEEGMGDLIRVRT